jgi:hypothetical protein
MVAKANRTDWQPENGIAVMEGIVDATGETVKIAVPLAAFPKLCAEARRFLSGSQAKANQPQSHGQMHYVEHSVANTYNVGILPTTDGEKISLVLDRGLDTQIGFAIEPEHARELGQELLETANRASNSRPARN